MNHTHVRKTVTAALFCALIFAATMLFLPAPTVGNVNLGDAAILLCAHLLGGAWAVAAAAIGSALCDLLSGYAVYAPATLVIKALMTVVALLSYRALRRLRLSAGWARAVAAIAAEAVMVAGYYLFEATVVLDSFAGALVSIPFNAVQGAVAIVIFCTVSTFLSRTGLAEKLQRLAGAEPQNQ